MKMSSLCDLSVVGEKKKKGIADQIKVHEIDFCPSVLLPERQDWMMQRARGCVYGARGVPRISKEQVYGENNTAARNGSYSAL